MLQHAATRCNTMQHAAIRCNTLQNTATRLFCQTHSASDATRCDTLECSVYLRLQFTSGGGGRIFLEVKRLVRKCITTQKQFFSVFSFFGFALRDFGNKGTFHQKL